MELTVQQQPASSVLEVTRHRLIRIMGWSHKGQTDYKRVDESFRRWSSTTFEFKNAWYSVEANDWVDVIVVPFKKVELFQNVRRHPIRAYWNEHLVTELMKNVKPLNLSLYFSLCSAGAKQSYVYLDYRREAEKSNDLIMPLAEYAIHVGISKTRTNSQIKRTASK